MNNSPGIRSWGPRAVRTILIVEAVYLVLFNSLLYLPVTQSLVNQVRPDKFHVAWERAWTWYPFRVHATGISANGQTRTQQWQVDAPSASASIALLPLIAKRVWLSNVSATDVSYRQRPRLKAGKDYKDLIPFFPEIEGRDIVPAETRPQEKKRPWRLAIDGIAASGQHRVWIMNFKGAARGDLAADLRYESRGGPFSLSNGEFDLALDTMYISGDNEVFRKGEVKGTLEFKPFVPRENKNINILKYLLLDADVDIDANSLAFINLFTYHFNDMTIDGSGHLAGRVLLDSGNILPDNDLAVDAGDINIEVLGHRIEGEGALSLSGSRHIADAVELQVNYRDLQVTHGGDTSPLLAGKQLRLGMTSASSLFAKLDEKDTRRSLTLTIDSLTAPDLALFEHYLPEKWPFQLLGGTGSLHAAANITPNAMAVDVSVKSRKADLGLRQYRFDSDLDMTLKLSNPSITDTNTSIAGSYLRLTNANFTQDGQAGREPWEAFFSVVHGDFAVFEEREKQQQKPLTDLFQGLANSEGRQVLEKLHGFMVVESEVSNLGWIGTMVDEAYHFAITGRGELQGTVQMRAGMPASGTDIEALSDNLKVRYLDYISTGEGRIGLQVVPGDSGPDWLLKLDLDNADLLRQGEKTAYVQGVKLEIAALLEDFDKGEKSKASAVTLRILSADVTDMSIYNSYLPADSPFRVVAGTASLSADIQLEPDNAVGWLKLGAVGMKMIVDDQSISADLAARIKLVDGIPGEMVFDLSGSEVELDNVRVIGEKALFDDERWLARFRLTRGETTWKKPLELDGSLQIDLSDSTPIVAIFGNRGYKPDWLLNMLSVDAIHGVAEVVAANNQLVIPYASAVSEHIEVGAKGRISEQNREGVIYARYRKMDAILKISAGDRNIDITRARAKYDAYRATP